MYIYIHVEGELCIYIYIWRGGCVYIHVEEGGFVYSEYRLPHGLSLAGFLGGSLGEKMD